MANSLILVPISALIAAVIFTSAATAQSLSTLTILLSSVSGEQMSGATLGEGKVTIVMFWLTSCSPSKRLIEAVQPLAEEFGGKATFVAVSIDNTKTVANVVPYVTSKGYMMTVLIDAGRELFERVNGTEHPYTLVFDDEGSLQWLLSGFYEGDEEQLREEVTKLLDGKE